jgi:5-methylcytosine-specific restriction endonuclease McrA
MTNATRPTSITCAHCGAEKKVGERGPVPTYCSGACRAAVKYELSKRDGRYERDLSEARQRTARRRIENARPCPYCNAPMSNPRRVQCGADSCRLRFTADRMRQWQRNYRETHGVWPRANHPESQRAAALRRRQAHGHWRELYPERAAAYDARRRALVTEARVGESFAPADIHERDGWTCKLCGQPIDRSIAWPHPKSPSLDHIVPLSRGGAHSMGNVQSAHLGCNSSKGNRLMVDAVSTLARLAGEG